jgi:phage baseplate assembly protein gpV
MSEQDIESLAQDRLLSNIAVMGRVIATEFARETGMVRVRIGPDDEKSAEYDMPWIRKRGGNDWEWWAPEKDEQVLIISPDGDLDRAMIIGSLPYKNFADSLTPDTEGKRRVLPEGESAPPTPEKKKDESSAHVIQYNDKTTTSYDKELHILHATFLEDKTIDLKVDAKKDEEKAELKFKKKSTEKISITVDALDKKENINLKLKEDIAIDLKRDEDKKEASIDIKVKEITVNINGKDEEEKVTIDTKGESILEMDGKGNIKVTAKDITMTLADDGSVTVDCKKLTFTSEKDVEVKSTGANVTVKSEGGDVNVEADTNVVVKGKAIKLNC